MTRIYRLAYWLQRKVVCPWNHGRQQAHIDHVQAFMEERLVELRKVHGDAVQIIPGTGCFFIPDKNAPGGGQTVSGDNIVPFKSTRDVPTGKPL